MFRGEKMTASGTVVSCSTVRILFLSYSKSFFFPSRLELYGMPLGNVKSSMLLGLVCGTIVISGLCPRESLSKCPIICSYDRHQVTRLSARTLSHVLYTGYISDVVTAVINICTLHHFLLPSALLFKNSKL